LENKLDISPQPASATSLGVGDVVSREEDGSRCRWSETCYRLEEFGFSRSFSTQEHHGLVVAHKKSGSVHRGCGGILSEDAGSSAFQSNSADLKKRMSMRLLPRFPLLQQGHWDFRSGWSPRQIDPPSFRQVVEGMMPRGNNDSEAFGGPFPQKLHDSASTMTIHRLIPAVEQQCLEGSKEGRPEKDASAFCARQFPKRQSGDSVDVESKSPKKLLDSLFVVGSLPPAPREKLETTGP
jgi:hypothetical protein